MRIVKLDPTVCQSPGVAVGDTMRVARAEVSDFNPGYAYVRDADYRTAWGLFEPA